VRALVVGGKLQGTEAVYLAAKAGWQTVLVDRREAPPASGIADAHVVTDVTADETRTRSLVTACDVVLPACEDEETLAWLAERVPAWGVPLLFDLDAYRVTASKLASRRLFAELGVPRPGDWPSCGLPAVVKPSSASGSEGVTVVHDEHGLAAARRALELAGHEVVVEEYVPGPSLSLEVLAWGGRAVPLQVTGLEFDVAYDCKRVVAPVGETGAGAAAPAGPGGSCDWERAVAPEALAALDAAGVRLAEGLGLNGLMDVEVMVSGPEPKLLEIDARLPSQTPTAVYWSSGLNIVELLAQTALRGAPPVVDRTARRACVYQHVRAERGMLDVLGEHVMSAAGPLRLVPGFLGADEALTDYAPGRDAWSATLIVTAERVSAARARAAAVVAELARREGLRTVPESDEAPDTAGGGPG
jgi:pyrrolysine biosynthesis protein PylC